MGKRSIDRAELRNAWPSNSKRTGGRRAGFIPCLALVVLSTLYAGQTGAQESDPTGGSTSVVTPSPPLDDAAFREAEREAQKAEAAAAEARAFADSLARPGAKRSSEEGAVTREALEDAVARAEAAADQAALAARAVDEAKREMRWKTQRTGLYVGAAFFYAAENFDDSIIVKSSTGGAGFIGYRIAPLFAVEFRYEGFEGFDLDGTIGRGEIDGYAITVNGKVFPFEGAIQPFVSVGVGGVRFRQQNVFIDGSRSQSEEGEAAFRMGGGIDLWLTNFVVLNFEASYLAPVDDLSNLDSTVLSSGLTFRF